ncbi:hypothetical protein AAII07_39405 [Microvirga sp. 0TCS3.31]
MDPLIVAGGSGELVDALLSDLGPVTHTDLRYDFVKVPEDPQYAP